MSVIENNKARNGEGAKLYRVAYLRRSFLSNDLEEVRNCVDICGNSKCKGPEVERGLLCWRNRTQADVTRAKSKDEPRSPKGKKKL